MKSRPTRWLGDSAWAWAPAYWDPSRLGSRLPQSSRCLCCAVDAGSLRAADAGKTVTLAGWVARRRDHGVIIFIDLRDVSGVAQVVFRDEGVLAQAHRLRAEFCVAVTGVVEIRPEGNANAEIATGEIEVNATALTVLGKRAVAVSSSTRPPARKPRLRYRYLDLRREGPNTQSGCAQGEYPPRAVLADHDFVEIETPTLTRSTPEGARDFLVPARLQPGSFYALPQGAAVQTAADGCRDGALYYQIARCYRRGFRADPAAGVHPAGHGDTSSNPTT